MPFFYQSDVQDGLQDDCVKIDSKKGGFSALADAALEYALEYDLAHALEYGLANETATYVN